ncbi:hypothetical protein EDB82DRAFT_437641, partial [Fusarium venenatum]|uniref:uncharacterized protein n=1 Tax=Fusarium venenatum TaxID=56646 RepID=UPI001D804BFF
LIIVLFSIIILFTGIFQPPTAQPGFYIFIYYISRITYLISGISITGLAGNTIIYFNSKLTIFRPPTSKAYRSFMQQYIRQGALGTLLNRSITANYSYYPL